MEQTIRVFKALVDTTRLRIVGAIVDRARSAPALAAELGLPLGAVTHHLAVLAAAGLLLEGDGGSRLDPAALPRAVKAVAPPSRTPGPVEDEERDVLRNFYAGPKLRSIPAQRRKKEIVFEELLRRLPRRGEWPEAELNRAIEVVHPDFCTIRRELVIGGYLVRDKGVYWLGKRGRAVIATARAGRPADRPSMGE